MYPATTIVANTTNDRLRKAEAIWRAGRSTPEHPQPQNSSITSSSIASDGRHSTRPRAARSAVRVEQADLASTREGRSELVGAHDLGQVDQRARRRRDRYAVDRGDVIGMQSWASPDPDAGDRGVGARVRCGLGDVHVDRLV